jgi:acetyltransferase-like isoleucine patch superfamily enzyme
MKNILNFISQFKWRYLFFSRSYVRFFPKSHIDFGNNIKVSNAKIIVMPNCSLQIGDNVIIKDAEILIYNGELVIGENSIIKGTHHTHTQVSIEDGFVNIAHHSIIAAKKIWIRFGGILNIGSYTNINAGTEVRCDERIFIGNYCQISYNIRIWDTNTHNIYKPSQRRFWAEKYYPFLGKEIEKPITKPIIIGDDCWLGEKSAILKGSILGNSVNVGFNTVISGQVISDHQTVVTDIKLKIF